jgi:prephenate dehydrogenase
MGGSVAWQAVRAGVPRVIGYSANRAHTAAAVRAGAVTDAASSHRTLVRECDLVVLAVPPVQALALLTHLGTELRRDGYCTDVAAVKTPVVRVADEAGLASRFAGSHPLVEAACSGFAGAIPNRFRGAVVYVATRGVHDRAAREIADFWAGVLEAEPVLIDAESHDAVVGWTTHLPVVVATALAAAYAADGPRGATLGGTARAATLPAAALDRSSAEILLLNRAAVLEALDGFEDAAGRLRQALATGDLAALVACLAAAAAWRRGFDQ